jgi:hypothetical protein
MLPSDEKVIVSSAPFLTLWADVVASRLGFDWDESLTLGRAVAGLNAQTSGRPDNLAEGEQLMIELLGHTVPAARTPAGLRALDKGKPASPQSVERYLKKCFGEARPAVRAAMAALPKSLSEEELATHAFEHYERFWPEAPAGKWGAKDTLYLSRISLTR